MGWFSFLAGLPKEQRTQMYFRDDGRVTFRKLPFDGTALIEYENDKPKAAFKHYYKTEYPFAGYGKIPADQVSLGYGRDIVLDVHGLLDKDERPPSATELASRGTKAMASPYIAQIGADKRYKITSMRAMSAAWDKYTVTELIVIVLLALTIALKIGTRGG